MQMQMKVTKTEIKWTKMIVYRKCILTWLFLWYFPEAMSIAASEKKREKRDRVRRFVRAPLLISGSRLRDLKIVFFLLVATHRSLAPFLSVENTREAWKMRFLRPQSKMKIPQETRRERERKRKKRRITFFDELSQL